MKTTTQEVERRLRAGDEEMWLLVDGLPDRERAIIILKYRDGRTLARIAHDTMTTVTRVRHSEQNAIRKLRDWWGA